MTHIDTKDRAFSISVLRSVSRAFRDVIPAPDVHQMYTRCESCPPHVVVWSCCADCRAVGRLCREREHLVFRTLPWYSCKVRAAHGRRPECTRPGVRRSSVPQNEVDVRENYTIIYRQAADPALTIAVTAAGPGADRTIEFESNCVIVTFISD